MRTKTRTFALEALLTAVAVVLTAGGCTHYWERPGGAIADFERDSAACVDDARKSPYGPVADNNQFGGPEGEGDFLNPPPALGGTRYYQNR